jgi:cytoskeletal protein RodZ
MFGKIIKILGIVVLSFGAVYLAVKYLFNKENPLLGNTATSNGAKPLSGTAKNATKKTTDEDEEKTENQPQPQSTINAAGVDTSLKVGVLLVDNTEQQVYQQKTGVNLYGFYNAIGFLEDGTMVFKEIMNAGQPDEYMYYRT